MVANQSKKIPFSQMILGLDKLFFGNGPETDEQLLGRAGTIEAYIEGCGYTWDEVLDGICAETARPTVNIN
jgi:hypothetical protein